MAAGGEELGKAYISVHADTSKLDAELAAARAKVDQAVTPGTGGGSAIPGGGGSSGPRVDVSPDNDPVVKVHKARGKAAEEASESTIRSLEKEVGAVTRFLGKVAAIGGITVTFYKIGEAIREAFENRLEKAADSAERFKQALDFGDVAGSLGTLDKQIADVQSRIAGRQEQNPLSKLIGFARGESTAALEAEAASLEETRQLLQGKRDAEQAKREEAERQKAKEAAERKAKEQAEVESRLSDEYKDVLASGMSGKDKINFDFDRRVGEVQRGLSEATKSERAVRLALIDELEKARLRSIEKLKQEEIDAAKEAANKALQEQKRFADEVGRAVRQAMEGAFTVTDTSLERIEIGINRLIQVIQLRDGQGL